MFNTMNEDTFKWRVNIDENKKYKIIEICKPLSSLNKGELHRLNNTGFFNFNNLQSNDILETYLFIEEDTFNNDKGACTSIIRYLYPNTLGSEFGKVLIRYQIDRCEKTEEAIKNSSAEEYFKIINGDYSNLIVKLKKYKKDNSVVQAFIFNKLIDLIIPNKFLEKTEIDKEIFEFSLNYNRANVINNKRTIIIDAPYLLIWSLINYPNLYSIDADTYVGPSYGFYFTLLKLKQLYQEYRLVLAFGNLDLDYYFNFSEFKKLNLSSKKITLTPILEYNLNWCKELSIALGYDTYQHSIRTCDMINTISAKYSRAEYIYIYSRDKNLLSLCTDKIELYFNKVSFNGYDEIVDIPYICDKYKINKVSDLIHVRALKGDGFSNVKGIKDTLYNDFIDVYKRLGIIKTLEELKLKSQFKEFMESEYFINLNKFTLNKYSLISFNRTSKQPSKLYMNKLLLKNSFYRESSVIDLMFPILISEV